MTSILHTIAAKSDQLNAEDLIGGPRTITVTGVRVNNSEDQPVWISFEGDNGKPFKPCKTMRRLLIRVWGDDSSVYAGRAMTLYLDPEVKYGGMKVGGIRISAMSHLDKPQSFFLTETRGRKKQHTVTPLQAQSAALPNEPTADVISEVLQDAEKAAKGGVEELTKWWNSPQVKANGSLARKIVSGSLPGTVDRMSAMQEIAAKADEQTQDDAVTEDDPFSSKVAAE
ncbi:hypothetical protein PhaeoP72_01174 [Phaeobacter inhibens]|uniref:hypothetical protein n=1 Tax=Phaeobacter inhibens TaxID=221822 RepID=UPI000C9BD6D2|nr:hypothetical protein [Phaeobacter inhibens]AUR03159.1 hypothetical protein PhaeoP72_01174 [Phaeobacter inhibens]